MRETMAETTRESSRSKARNARPSYAIYRDGETTDDIRFTINLVLVARRWRSLLDEHLRTIGQSAARMEALAAIMNSPTLSAQVNIAKRLRIEGPTMTRMLDTLEKDGLVQRLPDPTDRRTKQLRLTDEGEQVLEQIFAIADVLRDRLLDGVPAEQIDQQNAFMAGLMQRLDAGLPAQVAAEVD
ncbi:MAG: Transcriptional regulator SlyA [Pseudomonadota bacterium]|jgi:MarR family transcriptional regulator for hemolysin